MSPEPATTRTSISEAVPAADERRDPDVSGWRARFAGWWRAGVLGVRARLPEIAVTVAASAFFGWSVSKNGYGQTYYAAAVRSMGGSWRNFLFGSFDSASFITVDKTPASLWVMELSVRAFGLNYWSLLMPQALEGVATVGVLYTTVRRWFGPAAAIIAGAVMALTPVATLMFRYNNPDSLLVLVMGVWLVRAWRRSPNKAAAAPESKVSEQAPLEAHAPNLR